MHKLFVLYFALLPLQVFAQDVAHFTDKLNRFWVFDAGQFYKLEHLRVSNIQLGGNYLIYEDQLSQVKEYRNGKTKILDLMPTSQYYQTAQQLMVSNTQGALKVYFENKQEIVTLTRNMPDVFSYALGDSILAFIDFDRYFKAFYKGKKQEITNQALREYKVGDNSIAYVTQTENLYSYYDGNSYEIDRALPNEYQIGNNGMVGYINRFNELWVFDNQENKQLSTVLPQNWAMGNDMIVWLNEASIFKCYYKGNTTELMPLAPRAYNLTDSLLTYTDERGFFNAYYKGKNYLLEPYQPQKIVQKGGIVAYTDLDGRIKAFYEGEQVKVSPEIASDFNIMGRTIIYYINKYEGNNGDAVVYWNKALYRQ